VRFGQEDPEPTWTTIQCRQENFDAVSIARCDGNLPEADAILLVEEMDQSGIIIDNYWEKQDLGFSIYYAFTGN